MINYNLDNHSKSCLRKWVVTSHLYKVVIYSTNFRDL